MAGRGRPQRLKPWWILRDLRRGLKPRPFKARARKARAKAESFRNFDRVQLDSRALEWEEFHSLLKTCDFR
jgi:hypothetical protein